MNKVINLQQWKEDKENENNYVIMDKRLGKRGQELFISFMNTLIISEELAIEIINRNCLACSFITDEDCLSIQSKWENMNILLGITLFREDGDREPLKDNEVKILKDSYNIIYHR